MSEEKRRELASRGGVAAHAKGVGHTWNSEEAREAGRKGGKATKASRLRSPPPDAEGPEAA